MGDRGFGSIFLDRTVLSSIGLITVLTNRVAVAMLRDQRLSRWRFAVADLAWLQSRCCGRRPFGARIPARRDPSSGATTSASRTSAAFWFSTIAFTADCFAQLDGRLATLSGHANGRARRAPVGDLVACQPRRHDWRHCSAPPVDEHRYLAVCQDFDCLAAEQKLGEATPAVRAHDDQIADFPRTASRMATYGSRCRTCSAFAGTPALLASSVTTRRQLQAACSVLRSYSV